MKVFRILIASIPLWLGLAVSDVATAALDYIVPGGACHPYFSSDANRLYLTNAGVGFQNGGTESVLVSCPVTHSLPNDGNMQFFVSVNDATATDYINCYWAAANNSTGTTFYGPRVDVSTVTGIGFGSNVSIGSSLFGKDDSIGVICRMAHNSQLITVKYSY